MFSLMIFKTLNMVERDKINVAIKKHWVVYIKPVIIFILALFFIYISFGIKTRWFSIVVLIFGVIIAVKKILKLVYLSSVTWIFNGNELWVVRGIFPWNKTQIQIPIFDLYDSIVYSNFLGHYLNFGHIRIRRTEGVTSQIQETYLAKAVNFSETLNLYIQEYKKSRNLIDVNQIQKSDLGIELQRLVDLRDTGAITGEEFEKLKKRLIDL